MIMKHDKFQYLVTQPTSKPGTAVESGRTKIILLALYSIHTEQWFKKGFEKFQNPTMFILEDTIMQNKWFFITFLMIFGPKIWLPLPWQR